MEHQKLLIRLRRIKRRGPSSLVREIEGVDAPGSGATNTTAHRVAAGLALACPAQPTTTSSRPATLVVLRERFALMMEIPAPAKAGAAVITMHHCEMSRSAAAHRQQEWHEPA
jgi:hypothetical protein